MTIRKVLVFPNKHLRVKAQPVETVDNSIKTLVDDLLETMYEYDGVGLASTQIGESARVLVMDVSDSRKKPITLINPEIIEKNDLQKGPEGCVSFPGVYAEVERAHHVKVKALDRDGKPFELEAKDLLAVCIQHEMDHLDGKVFVDYLSPLKRERLLKKLEKIKKLNM